MLLCIADPTRVYRTAAARHVADLTDDAGVQMEVVNMPELGPGRALALRQPLGADQDPLVWRRRRMTF